MKSFDWGSWSSVTEFVRLAILKIMVELALQQHINRERRDHNIWNSSTLEMDEDSLDSLGHIWLHSEFEISLK